LEFTNESPPWFSRNIWEVLKNGHQELVDIEEQTIVQLVPLRTTQVKDKTYRVVIESDFER